MNYCETIQKLIDYVEEHVKEDIDINTLIVQSGYSVSHFYRIFQAVTGESIREYMIKRKLSKAAVELMITKKRMIEIAVDYGFNSQEVFTRAFTKLFHVTPGKCRRNKNSIELFEKMNVYQKISGNTQNLIIPRIILEKEFLLVGMRKTVKPGNAFDLWEEFNSVKSGIQNTVSDDHMLGLCEYKPYVTDESEFEYMACVEVSDFSGIPEKMTAKTIPRSKYAVFTHEGSMDELKAIYNKIYGVWLPISGNELAERDTIEIYSLKNDADHNLDIYIPLKL